MRERAVAQGDGRAQRRQRRRRAADPDRDDRLADARPRRFGELLDELSRGEMASVRAGQRDSVPRGAKLAFGEPVDTVLRLSRKADVVLSLDADFLTCGRGTCATPRDFMSRRRLRRMANATHRPR